MVFGIQHFRNQVSRSGLRVIRYREAKDAVRVGRNHRGVIACRMELHCKSKSRNYERQREEMKPKSRETRIYFADVHWASP